MPYIERKAGVIIGLYANPQPGYAEEWLGDDDAEVLAFRNPPVLPSSPSLYAVAQLGIAPGTISGIDVNSRFAAALYLDVGLYYLLFTEPLPDTAYLAKAYDATARVSVSERATDYILITATDDGGVPTDPAEISVEIIRVG